VVRDEITFARNEQPDTELSNVDYARQEKKQEKCKRVRSAEKSKVRVVNASDSKGIRLIG